MATDIAAKPGAVYGISEARMKDVLKLIKKYDGLRIYKL
jgi:hypothetical protein